MPQESEEAYDESSDSADSCSSAFGLLRSGCVNLRILLQGWLAVVYLRWYEMRGSMSGYMRSMISSAKATAMITVSATPWIMK